MNARTATGSLRAGSLWTCGIALFLQVAACGAEGPAPGSDEGATPTAGEEPSPPPTGSAPPAEPEPPASGAPAPPPPPAGGPSSPGQGWTTGIIEADAVLQAAWPIPVVSAVRTGTNEGFDRLTVELGGGEGMPGYHVEYIDRPLHQCGSGNQIFPVGDGWLELRLEPAQAHTDEGRPTLPGREIAAEQRLMRRIYVTCDFEGVVTLVIAVESPNDFRVSTLSAPRRIVVDVRH